MAKVAEGSDERVSPGNDDGQREENGQLPLVERNGEAADVRTINKLNTMLERNFQ